LGAWDVAFNAQSALSALTFPTVGAIIASRRRENAIGWIFIVIGLSYAASAFCNVYADSSPLGKPGGLPGTVVAVWFNTWVWAPGFFLTLSFLLLLFPDGRLPSLRWWPVGWLAGGGLALFIVASWFAPNNYSGDPNFHNPIGIESARTILNFLIWAGLVLWPVGALGSTLALILRFRQSTGEVRQQIKWFAYAGIATLLLAGGRSVWATPSLLVLGFASVPLLPTASLIAILKYRLYDIDILINRTLVYGLLTLMLALVYFGGVTATQALFQALTSQQKLPQLVVVASTLLIAALFNPLRRRIQLLIDRSFYRRKYDARKTLEAFSLKLRDETNLEALRGDLVGVVRETMQPAHVSLWLRPEKALKGAQTE